MTPNPDLVPNPVEAYLSEVRDLHFSGAAVPETSFYPALSNLLNEVGHGLKPRIRCLVHPANQGAGLPDGGFFTQEQLPRRAVSAPLVGLKPARGAMEVKPASHDVWEVARSDQVARYVGDYGQVLVTNLRDFLLVGRDDHGQPQVLETFRLAPSEAEFWAQTAHPRTFAAAQGPRLLEFLQRVLLHAAPLTAPLVHANQLSEACLLLDEALDLYDRKYPEACPPAGLLGERAELMSRWQPATLQTTQSAEEIDRAGGAP